MVTTMRGKPLDMAALAANNSHKAALGNASMNARGDKIDADGNVLRAREDLMRDYNQSNPKAVKQSGLNRLNPDTFATPADAVANARKANLNKRAEAKVAPRRNITDSE